MKVQLPLGGALVQDNCTAPSPRCHPFLLTTNHYHLSPQAPPHRPSAKTSLPLVLRRKTSRGTLVPRDASGARAVGQHGAEVQVEVVGQRLKKPIVDGRLACD